MKYNGSGDCGKVSSSTHKTGRKTVSIATMPNPAKDKVAVDLDAFGSREVALLLMDITGNVVLETKVHSSNASLDLSTVASGVYMLYAHTDGAHAAVKLVKP